MRMEMVSEKTDLCAQINLKQYQLSALKHTNKLRGMASTLPMRTAMSPNKGETAVHGRHCRGDMVVRMYRGVGTCASVRLISIVYKSLSQFKRLAHLNF